MKKLTIIFLMILTLTQVTGQELPWSAFFGNEGAEFAYDIKQTPDDGYVVAAYANDGGLSDFYIVKLDQYGDLSWERLIGEPTSPDRAHSVNITPDGDFIITGSTTSNFIPWIVKLDAQGDTVWTSQWANQVENNTGILAKSALLPDGRIAVISQEGYYGQEPFLYLADENGELLEARDLYGLVPIGWYSGTIVNDIETTTDGGFILTGATGGSSASRSFLWKFNANADSVWSKVYDDTGIWMRSGQSVKQTTDGGYIIAGYDAPNSNNTCAIRADAQGNLIWYSSYPDTLYTQGTDVIEWKSGEFIMSEKRFSGFGASFFESALLRIDSLGNELSRDPIIGSDSSTTITQMRRTTDGGFVVAGEINEYLSIGEQDLFILKSDSLGNFDDVTIDYVWPGDVNYDGVVNMQDLMILGVIAGATGPEREDKSISWYPHYVTDWADTVVTGVNFKHADTDGNGIVDLADTVAIIANYDSTHAAGNSKSFTLTDSDLYIVPNQAQLVDETMIEIPVYLGSANAPVNDIYGLSFRLEYDQEVLKPGSAVMNYGNSWLGEENASIWDLSMGHISMAVSDFGVTRSNHESVSGHGLMGVLMLELNEPLQPGNSITFDLAFFDLFAHNYSLESIELFSSDFQVTLENSITGIDEVSQHEPVKIYPSPLSVGQQLNIVAASPIRNIEIFNLQGRTIYNQYFGIISVESVNFSTSLPRGVYLIRIEVEGKTHTGRLLVR